MKVILAVTDDEYELPVAVADTQSEMCRIIGISESRLSYAISRGSTSKQKEFYGAHIRFIVVPIDEEDEDG